MFRRKTLQLTPSELGRVSKARASPLGLSNPPEIAFWPAPHATLKSFPALGFSDQGCDFTLTRAGAAAAIPPVICVNVEPFSFFALSATSARFASAARFRLRPPCR